MGISFSKMLENSHRRINDEAILEFRELVNSSLSGWVRKVDDEWNSLSPERFLDENDMEGYKNVLDDQYHLASQVRNLANELSITALYKLVEIHTKKVIKWHLPSIESKKLFNINSLDKALPFNLADVKSYSNFDELRELNNSIKHLGTVSEKLSEKYSNNGWKQGNDLEHLDKVYERLAPKISVYMDDLAAKIYEHSERDDT